MHVKHRKFYQIFLFKFNIMNIQLILIINYCYKIMFSINFDKLFILYIISIIIQINGVNYLIFTYSDLL